MPGVGIDDVGDERKTKARDSDLYDFTAEILDLSDASLNSVELGQWEESLEQAIN